MNTGHHRLYTIGRIVKQTELPKVGSIWQHGATLPTGFFALKLLCFDNQCWKDSKKTEVKHVSISGSEQFTHFKTIDPTLLLLALDPYFNILSTIRKSLY